MSLIYPCDVHTVTDSFTDHQDRTPPSVNPGTDYAAKYGSDVYAVADGTVTDITYTFYGSGGRMVHIDHDNGDGSDYLHLSSIKVSRVGQRVKQGDIIAVSGASGFGKEWYYGPHLHISYRHARGHAYTNYKSVDFDALIKSTATAGGNAKPLPLIKKGELLFCLKLMNGSDIQAFIPFDPVKRQLHVIDNPVWTEYNVYKNIDTAYPGLIQPVDQAGWAEFQSRGYTRT